MGIVDFAQVKFACWGDSLTAAGSGYATVFGTAYTPNRGIYNGGVGGETIAQAYAHQTADAASIYRDRVMLIHDKLNSGEDATAYVATVQAMVAYQRSGKFLIISGIYTTDGVSQEPGSAYYIAQTTVNQALAALYPGNFLDVSALLASDSTRTDHVHLTSTARDTILIPAIQAKLVALGYMNVTS